MKLVAAWFFYNDGAAKATTHSKKLTVFGSLVGGSESFCCMCSLLLELQRIERGMKNYRVIQLRSGQVGAKQLRL